MFAQKIINSIRTLSLECEPIDSVSVNISPSISGISHSVVGKSLLFDKDIPEGHTITADYKCRK
jgi:hypothetical protein